MFIPILLIVNKSHCNNPPTESTLDPPYDEIQEIYENKAKADKVKELKLNNKLSDKEHS